MRKLPALFSLITSIGLWYACTQHPQSKNVSDKPIIKINNHVVNIAYTDIGKGDTTLLFVHGWCINKSYFNEQAKYFGNKYRVITMDLPGYGQSGKNRNSWTVNDFASDVTSVITTLKLKNVILVGHSMAGEIIVQAKLNAPQQVIGLVGIDNFKGFDGKPKTAKSKADYAEAIAMLKKHFKAVATAYFNQDLFYKTTSAAIRKRILNDVANADSAIAIASMEDNNFNTTAKLKASKIKLHLINSDYTPNDTIGFIKAGIPYQLLQIHATGHFPMIEKPAEFNRLLQQAINQI
ncbi:Pimeloyl-ACP methyl ester carboxylesterase [Mucilaginibacter gossypiicola]|uniref:Pimeloyl-ACP methyl ester carboxylesterase n=1 Tax=Mucilaginibacter gossypiicola TaxID=551995 RepID=A0A1H8HJ64_9SPHI|nr:alpha/beta hydrolase [Mucilaginibacter gossypiicola]SEN56119.1 Pimeloyl-ACP methyl ester carboxylesterase [Mucilaginibacter gossypiicola]